MIISTYYIFIKDIRNMETIVLKFGGSSLADNDKLNIVAKKVIDFYNQGKRIIVVVSAQGKTTDHLIAEAKELAQIPLEREMDTLLSTGEQISISKLSILLNNLGYSAISLTGWQAGIYTSEKNQDAKIEKIDTSRIEKELNKEKLLEKYEHFYASRMEELYKKLFTKQHIQLADVLAGKWEQENVYSQKFFNGDIFIEKNTRKIKPLIVIKDKDKLTVKCYPAEDSHNDFSCYIKFTNDNNPLIIYYYINFEIAHYAYNDQLKILGIEQKKFKQCLNKPQDCSFQELGSFQRP